MIQISYDIQSRSFICRCNFDERDIPKRAGFFWSPVSRLWETKKISTAARLREFFDESAKKLLGNNSVEKTPWPSDGRLNIPPTQRLRKFQEDGVRFALERNHSYIAFEQGLGKTPTAITIINTCLLPTLIVCPPFLVENWKREIAVWSRPDVPQATIESGSITTVEQISADVVILPDSLLDKQSVRDFIRAKDFGLLVIDEAHRFKTATAKRTLAVWEIATTIPKVVCLSGTPMPNRPIELYPVLAALAHNTIDFMSLHQYAEKFCAAFKHQHGWDYSGASNLDLLAEKLKPFMLRRTKAEMLPELKPKEERVVILNETGTAKLEKMQMKLMRKFGSLTGIVRHQSLGEVAKYRREVGRKKLSAAIEYIRDILDTTDEQVLVFAWHLEVLDALADHLGGNIISGEVPNDKRQKFIDHFQNGGARLLIAQLTTMVGYNLTAASRCVFVEASWSPGDNAQASDRAHRIGQKNSVTVDYLVLSDSIDERIITSILNKQKNISRLIG